MSLLPSGETPGPDPKAGEMPTNGNGQPAATTDAGDPHRAFETWLAEQPETTQSLIDAHYSALRTSIDSERQERKRLEREVKRIVKSASDQNELKPELMKLQTELSEQTTRASFFEEAHKRGISNLRLAYHAAKFEDLIDGHGRIDWDELKAKVPELFTAPPSAKPTTPRGTAGQGSGMAGAKQTVATGMNALLRRAAGRL